MSAGLKMEIILSYLRDYCFDETKKTVVLRLVIYLKLYISTIYDSEILIF